MWTKEWGECRHLKKILCHDHWLYFATNWNSSTHTNDVATPQHTCPHKMATTTTVDTMMTFYHRSAESQKRSTLARSSFKFHGRMLIIIDSMTQKAFFVKSYACSNFAKSFVFSTVLYKDDVDLPCRWGCCRQSQQTATVEDHTECVYLDFYERTHATQAITGNLVKFTHTIEIVNGIFATAQSASFSFLTNAYSECLIWTTF